MAKKKGKKSGKAGAARKADEGVTETADKTQVEATMETNKMSDEVEGDSLPNVKEPTESTEIEQAAAETVEAGTVEADTVEAETVEADTVEADTEEAETGEEDTGKTDSVEADSRIEETKEAPPSMSTEENEGNELISTPPEVDSTIEHQQHGKQTDVKPVASKRAEVPELTRVAQSDSQVAEREIQGNVAEKNEVAASEMIRAPDMTVDSEISVPRTPEKEPVQEADEALKQKTSEIEHSISSFNSPPLPPRAPEPSMDTPQTPSLLLSPQSPPATQSPISPALPPRQVKKHPVPPPLHEELKSKEFIKNMAVTNEPPPMPPRINRNKRLDSAADINLVVNRFCQTSHHYQRQDEHSREGLEKGKDMLKTSYSIFLDSLPKTAKPPSPTKDFSIEHELRNLEEDERAWLEVDWAYWTQVVNDFPSVANDPDKFEEKIADGIPAQIRGIIWQLIANSKSTEFEDIFVTLLDTESPHEASIRRDLKRTKFIPKEKVESLFNVMKVYSVYDPDVGYTQGMAFIATPLILNCETEAESFGLLIRLMKSYGLRELFLPEMPGLMLLLYQFDRLFEENSPQLYNHLTRQGVRSSMYATQWFLTFFAYKFPLAFVLRIYDIVFAEGIESILRIAVNLMLKNAEQLLLLKFDKLLDFLKNELFAYYLKGTSGVKSSPVQSRQDGEESETSSVVKRDLTTIIADSAALNDNDYDINSFVHDAMHDVHVTPISLKRYAAEYEEIHQIEQQKEAQFESVRIKNKQLQHEVRKLEHDYTLLNREHIEIANELIKNRLKIETLLDENNDQKLTILDLKRQLQEEIRKQQLPNPDAEIPSDLRADLDRTIKRNAEVMSSNLKLQDKINEQEKIIEALRAGSRTPTSGAVPFKQPLAGAFSKLFKNDNS